MSDWVPGFLTAYRLLLACYPPGFRAEFGGEMLEVLATALREAQHGGSERPWRLCWREIRDWPRSVVVEHLRERRSKMASTGSGEEKPVSHGELLVAMALFVLPLFGILGKAGIRPPQWLDTWLLILCAGALVFVLGWALVKGFPRWSLPYLGYVLLFGTLVLLADGAWGWIYPLFRGLFGPRLLWSVPVAVLYAAAFELISLLAFLVGALLLVNLLRLPPHTRGVWQGIRADWTRLSFLLYGGLAINLWLLFDEYRHDGLWLLAAWIALTLGAWGYLRARGQRQRIVALIGGATGTMWIVALAKWVLIPLQTWPTVSEVTRWVEAGDAMTGWVCILALLLAPALLGRGPQATATLLSPEGDATKNLYGAV